MIDPGRREFLTKASVLSLSAILPTPFWSTDQRIKRQFKTCLNPGSIGVQLSQQALLDSAITYGFEAIVPLTDQLATMRDQGLDTFVAKMKENQITWGTANLPVQFRESAPDFRSDFSRLNETAYALELSGAKRMSTWIMPTHDKLTYRQNFDRHTRRLKEVALLLADHDIMLGLEYVGPKTLMSRDKYSFIRTMTEVQELITAINEPNVGIQLDTFHWYCAGESDQDILNLDPKTIVTVDLNDAKVGRTPDEQLDWERELPAATGVIDIEKFLIALLQVGYDGPVRAEPFNEELNKLDNEAALQKTMEAMRKTISIIE
ncbi:sugar phosphate isomerase/epimerase family protein [Roseivirga sp. E12]|uniref:sugar phosphate isomerase/epimerase family protein n=1 Tax=Roseivirga sp. E12 TaxID=2819237 RepID=UPI001ABCDD95|nr:sugar phosphate isomerase/epimerase family protein [Roseivirga sp. E12]MBO3697096.1 sugar phosphate isomerase/epimerase [Roseivirga sp. E12]